jgi:hypothetical protein
MANYFISFDTPETANEQERIPMFTRIHETFGTTKTFQATKNGWFINTEWSADDLHSWLRLEVHPARAIVISITDFMYGEPPDSRLPVWLYSDDSSPSG